LQRPEHAELANLIAAVAGGDRLAFKRLYDRASPKLFAIILRIVRDRSSAEDILQDVFLRIWRSAGSYSAEAGAPSGWLNSIARNRSIDIMRQTSLEPPRSEGPESDWSERIAELRDREADIMDIAALRHCLGEIEESARRCVLLAYYEGYSREELAQRFDKPVSTIKTWLHRSLATLKTCLETVS
jgi:RNA polymerase sigma-70 factor (ECF subfamily)